MEPEYSFQCSEKSTADSFFGGKNNGAANMRPSLLLVWTSLRYATKENLPDWIVQRSGRPEVTNHGPGTQFANLIECEFPLLLKRIYISV